MSIAKEFSKGIIKENPVLRLLLGLCPVLGVTTAAMNGLGMGLASTFVLTCSNIVISLLRNVIPAKVRIPCFIVVIATFVTIVDMSMNAFIPDLHANLGLFIPLIVVNCVILGRAEAFASKNSLPYAIADGVGIGLGFTLTLVILGSIREILGAGAIFGYVFTPEAFEPFGLFASPAGAFIGLGFLLAGMNLLSKKLKLD
ncbi:electron transport complex subunit RsxE [Candidatus Contubernalis alkaliaceticus]|uniref:electron transport complex subunit RsxE n=1 Tax=Candidatus Contubernalis alkaliaceticus TaxID=338645 RepID=UPI001F4BE781|nr:electron transport complex subunit E [Candidatus Contubernalis alkalaceticus]UNC90904.1 electron transport complex subunit E [Candidatus Contubernalis alkalaceticus]